jgi:uncharacterized membrane protein YdbT with pleckstrin-like domain
MTFKILELEEGEEILRIVRKHPFPFVMELTLLILAMLLPAFIDGIVAYLLSTVSTPVPGIEKIPFYVSFAGALWYLFIWCRLFVSWTDFYLDKWVITNKRIVASEQVGLFNRQTSSIRLDKIQDVTADVKGLIATLLDYGDIQVQSAGVTKEFIMKTAPSPKELKDYIFDLHDKAPGHHHGPSA